MILGLDEILASYLPNWAMFITTFEQACLLVFERVEYDLAFLSSLFSSASLTAVRIREGED